MCTAELNESQKDCHSFGSPVNFLVYNFGNFALKAWVETPGLLWSGSLDSFPLVWHRCNLTRAAWIWARNSSDSSTSVTMFGSSTAARIDSSSDFKVANLSLSVIMIRAILSFATVEPSNSFGVI